MEGDIRVNGPDHASLAMLPLGAVEPYWLGILDTDRVCEDLVLCGEGSVSGHVAGEEGVGIVGHNVLNGNTRVVES